MTDPSDFDDEPATGTICLACGGEFRCVEQFNDGQYKTVTCRWCTRGAMTPRQEMAWRDRRRR
jgi:hypothetical protein